MVVRRAPIGYQKIHVEKDLHEDTDGIELLQQYRQHSYEGRGFDNIIKDVEHESTLKLPNTMIRTTQTSHDDEFRLPTKSVEYRLQPSAEQRFLAGWRVCALLSLIGAASVCILNFAITIWVWKSPNYEIEGSIVTLFKGNCARARRMNVWIHLFINVLSTLLLNASNYCMQVLSAPNREELVRAHAQRYWLDIGVPSLRNLRFIGLDRAILWVLLFLTSVPLHLFFNSVVFTNLQANKYVVVPTMEDWLYGRPYNTSGFVDINATSAIDIASTIDSYRINISDEIKSSDKNTMSKYQNFSTVDCFNKYNSQYLSDAGNVYLIQDNPTVWRNPSIWYGKFNLTTGPFKWCSRWDQNSCEKVDGESEFKITNISIPFKSSPDKYPSNGWQCPSHREETCDVENEFEVPQDRSKWKPYESQIRYCMVEKVEELCRLQFSFPIAIVVVASNLIKALCMALLLFKYKKHAALVTLGDAVASFLDHPDPETRSQCLHSRHLIKAQWNWEFTNCARKGELGIEPERFNPMSQRWAMAPSGSKWLATYTLYFAAILTGIVCIARSLVGMPKDPVKLWEIGFGTVNGNNLLNVGTSLTGGILLANVPQAVLSYLYLAFNALYTNMFIAKEWSTYTNERKPLRVTSPIGQQRSTYWLNVPFRYAIPMTIMSGLFHWLASQSIFMVQITITDTHTRKFASQISTCGYSPVAIILTTVLGTVIAVGGLIMGRLKYPAGIPLVGSCSAAISASCHPSPEDVGASLLPVQWGAITHGKRGSKSEEPVGHCSFSSLPVEYPILGRLYA